MFSSVCSALLGLVLAIGEAVAQEYPQLETSNLTQSAQRSAFIDESSNPFVFTFADPEVAAITDNAAVLQQRVTKASNVFLSTLAEPGESQFLTLLKPCGILMPHMHMRANEFYSVIYGTMDAGLSQENGALQNFTFPVVAGQVMVVPQGLLHYNHNRQCIPNVFFQTFTSADGGAINIAGALAALRDASDAGAEAIEASGLGDVTTSPEGSFALDQECLKRCGLPEAGAPGDGLQLPYHIGKIAGLV